MIGRKREVERIDEPFLFLVQTSIDSQLANHNQPNGLYKAGKERALYASKNDKRGTGKQKPGSTQIRSDAEQTSYRFSCATAEHTTR